eukprot:TRINITY_DN8214_c0_g4_i1.p2 TRINITY_DN8214_c0_g4~~TRINITY_DN8214_c0_g4_i1.p2  ORF type:complete len:185 (+),score=61.86 TRINITY_DN8214_c0_g4_i1:51-605(+)
MLRRNVVLRGGGGMFRAPGGPWARPEDRAKFESDRPSEQHMVEEMNKGSAFEDMRRRMTRHRDIGLSFEPDEAGGCRGKQAETGAGADYRAYPYPAIYFGMFFFWFWMVNNQLPSGCRANYMIADVDKKHPHIKFNKGPAPHLGDQQEPLANPSLNSVSGDLCIIRPLPDVSHKSHGPGAQMSH